MYMNCHFVELALKKTITTIVSPHRVINRYQGRAGHTEDHRPTFVRKPVVHEKIINHPCPKTGLFDDTLTLLFNLFLRCDGKFNHWRCSSRRPVVSTIYRFSKESGTRSHEGTSVSKPVFLLTKIPYHSQQI